MPDTNIDPRRLGRVEPTDPRGFSSSEWAQAHPTLTAMMKSYLTDVGVNPMPMMIPTVGNLPMFEKLMDEGLKSIRAEGRSPETWEKAAAFYKARHPNFTEKFPVFDNPGLRLTNTAGEYVNGPSVGRKDPRLGTIRLNPWGRNLEDMVETIGHESTHGSQYAGHGPSPTVDRPTMYDFTHKYPGMRIPEDMWQEYFNHPSEVAARHGGLTARQEFIKYKSLRPIAQEEAEDQMFRDFAARMTR